MRHSSSALFTAVAVAVASAALVAQAPASFAGVTSVRFTDSQTGSWIVPQGVTSVTVDAVGGSGGTSNSGAPGGRGAAVKAQLPVTPGQTLSVHVAGNGSIYGPGANGGGAEGWFRAMGGGGGASDVRIGGDDLASRVLVAGGGGGASQNDIPPYGGDAGAPGGNGLANYCGGQSAQPGTQTAGGAGSVDCGGYRNGSAGSLGMGAAGAAFDPPYFYSAGGGGGGGYYGGGSGGDYEGGAGGSSYVMDNAGNATIGLAAFGTSPYVVITWTTPPAAAIQVSTASPSLPADGTSTTTVTARIADQYGNPTPGDAVSFSSTDPGVAFGSVVDRGDGTYTATLTASRLAHDVTITATDGSAQGSTIIGLSALPQTVTFGSPPATPKVGQTYSPVVAGGASGNPVVLSIPTGSAAVCSVAGTTVTFDHAGSCTIDADQAGDNTYAAGHASQTINVAPLSGAISFTSVPPVQAVVGGSYPVTAVGAPSGAPVVLSVDQATTGSACSMSASIVSFDHVGTCVIDADQAGTADYAASPTAQQTVTVTAIATSIGVTSSASPSVYGQPVHATATVTAGSGSPAGTVQFTVDGTDIGAPVTVSNGSAQSPDLTGVGGASLAPAAHTISASFTPLDTSVYAGAANSMTQVVDQAATSTSIAVHPTTITAVITPVAPGAGTPTGTVIFSVAGAPVGTAPVLNGAATLTYTVPSGKTQQIGAAYVGDTDFTGSSASTSRLDPVITATLSSAQPRSRYGWYNGPVRVSFHCASTGAPTQPCPASVLLSGNGAGQSVTRTIAAADGGMATVSVRGINIDRTAPSVRVTGVRNGGVYGGTAPVAHCSGHDALSGLASCTLTLRTSGGVTRYTVRATDRAGNSTSVSGSYQVLSSYLQGAGYSNGTFMIRTGRTYTLVVYAASRPTYYDAAVYPQSPTGRDNAFYAAGPNRWTLGITMTDSLRSHPYWNLGIKIGATMQIIKIHVI